MLGNCMFLLLMVISQPKQILNKKTTCPLERFFQVLHNLTKREFLAILVWKLQPYKGNPHGGGFGLREGTKVELQRFSIFCQICSHPLQKLMLAMRNT